MKEKKNIFTKKEIINHLKNKKSLKELYNPNGIEISGGIPSDFGDEITIEPTNSTDKEEKQAFCKQDKWGISRGYNTQARMESINNIIENELNKFIIIEEVDILSTDNEENNLNTIKTIKDNRPDIFLRVEEFITEINSFDLSNDDKDFIIKYLIKEIKK